jgi:hypothetical protein
MLDSQAIDKLCDLCLAVVPVHVILVHVMLMDQSPGSIHTCAGLLPQPKALPLSSPGKPPRPGQVVAKAGAGATVRVNSKHGGSASTGSPGGATKSAATAAGHKLSGMQVGTAALLHCCTAAPPLPNAINTTSSTTDQQLPSCCGPLDNLTVNNQQSLQH